MKNKNFPLQEIQKYSGVYVESVDPFRISGLGPDNTSICLYSDHWYNPLIPAGNAPKRVEDFFAVLKKKLVNQNLTFDLEDIKPTEKGPVAKDAAWSAHFLQDMTCPLHVVGMPGAEANENQLQGLKITGPFRTFDAGCI